MPNLPPRAGLLFLPELGGWAAGDTSAAHRYLLARAPDAPTLPPTVRPPAGVVVVARARSWALLEQTAPWLSLAERVAIVLDTREEPDRRRDAEHSERADLEIEEMARTLGNLVLLTEVTDDPEAAIAEALDRVSGAEPWPAWEAAPVRPAVSPGPWIPWSPPRLDGPPRALDRALALTHLVPALCLPPSGPALLDGLTGERLDLGTGERRPVPGLAGQASAYHPIAATPDGGGWLVLQPGATVGASGWMLRGARLTPHVDTAGSQAIGVDPSGRAAWTGHRCRFLWRVLTPRGPVAWAWNLHSWPIGHARKLWGFKDNDPHQVHLAPDASACLSTYEHDALLCPGLPLAWHLVGDVAVALRAEGEPSALLFEHGDGICTLGDPEVVDEDARAAAPVVCLGPGPALRYTVGLGGPTWRGQGEVGTPLGGPDGGWVTFDAAHREVRRGPERLLAGWHRWLVVEGEELVRIDLEGGCERLGPAGRPVTEAVALPGSPNVVLVSRAGQGAWLRLV